MKNLIYQFWNGPVPRGVSGSTKNIKQYADRIGADYLFEHDPKLLHHLKYGLFYGSFNPIFREEFHEYETPFILDPGEAVAVLAYETAMTLSGTFHLMLHPER